MARDDIPTRPLKILMFTGDDGLPMALLLNVQEVAKDGYGRLKCDRPVYVRPNEVSISALMAIVLRMPIVFEWEEVGLVQPVYPSEMVRRAAKEWVLRYPIAHHVFSEVEGVLRTEFGFYED